MAGQTGWRDRLFGQGWLPAVLRSDAPAGASIFLCIRSAVEVEPPLRGVLEQALELFAIAVLARAPSKCSPQVPISVDEGAGRAACASTSYRYEIFAAEIFSLW